MTAILMPPAELTADDRCDRCGAQARVRAVLPRGELLFCGHHGRAYGDQLSRVAVRMEQDPG